MILSQNIKNRQGELSMKKRGCDNACVIMNCLIYPKMVIMNLILVLTKNHGSMCLSIPLEYVYSEKRIGFFSQSTKTFS